MEIKMIDGCPRMREKDYKRPQNEEEIQMSKDTTLCAYLNRLMLKEPSCPDCEFPNMFRRR